ncbi:MAG: choice-of-anchor E domain-containing protein [Bryobacteraceae bacterium]
MTQLSLAALFCGAVFGARADTISFSGGGFGITSSGFSCDEFSACVPLPINVPQFDPSLGTLQSIEITLSVSQDVGFGINDEYDPTIGAPYEVNIVGGINASSMFPSLPNNIQGQTTLNEVSTGSGMIYYYGAPLGAVFTQTLSASGIDSNPLDFSGFEGTGSCESLSPELYSDLMSTGGSGTQFEGTGCLGLLYEPYGSAEVTADSVDQWPIAGIRFISDVGTLDITYTYEPVPEPRGYAVLFGLAFAIVLWLKKSVRCSN